MNTTTFLAAAAIATALVAPAHAGTTRVSTAVEYADLDLTTDAGAKALEQRVKRATIEMCATYQRRDGMGARPIGKCLRAAKIQPQVEVIVAQARMHATQVASR